MATKASYPAPSKQGPTERYGYWSAEISRAKQRWDAFYCDGDKVQDRYMLEGTRMDGTPGDKYNILYSSTETMKPSLYATTPKTQAKVRNVDQQNQTKVFAALLMEQIGDYGVEVVDFDRVMRNVVSDYVLPGMGQVWLRYDPKTAPANDDPEASYLTFEGLALDYVSYRDFLTGVARTWDEVPWVGRRVFFTEKQAASRFGKEKAQRLNYSFNNKDKRQEASYDSTQRKQAVIYEIWDKDSKTVIWFSEDYPDDVLDIRADFLKLERFFPCPEPLRAIWSTKTIIPKALYTQYRPQAAQLDKITQKIRILTDALKVAGIYDGSQEQLAHILKGNDNKMIAVQNWAAIIQNGGLVGSVQWVPLDAIVAALSELYKQREIAKGEIYEITGFSDIVRGVSKASETLGAQELKADWAGGRLKDMQREVQRFCRDIIRIMVEIAVEHFNDATLMAYAGVSIPQPTPEEAQAAAQAMAMGQPAPPTAGQQIKQQVDQVFALLRNQKLRCANLGVETDSTILPDEEKERQDRLMFLGQIGAFLQQAMPAAMQFPDMRGILGAMMMFVVRTFPQSRPLEKEFEQFTQKLAMQPPQDPNQGDKDKQQAAAAAAAQTAQIKAQSDQQTNQADNMMKKYEVDAREQTAQQKQQQDHEFRMAQLQLDAKRLRLEQIRLGVDLEDGQLDRDEKAMERDLEQTNTDNDRAGAALQQEFQQAIDARKQDAAEAQQAADMDMAERQQTAAEEQASTAADLQQQQIDQAQQALDNPPKKD